MDRNQLSFFAGPGDLKELLEATEGLEKMQYVIAGLFDFPKIESLNTLLDDRDLGRVKTGDPNNQFRYLVAKSEQSIKSQAVKQVRGGFKHAVDQEVNPDTIVFRSGGIFREGCLIAGQVGTASVTSESLRLFRLFGKEIRLRFLKTKSFYVGKQASDLLNKGWRLTANFKSPPIYDLVVKKMS